MAYTHTNAIVREILHVFMKKIFKVFVLSFLLCISIGNILPRVEAVDICDPNTCLNKVYLPYTAWVCTPVLDIYGVALDTGEEVCSWVTDYRWVCHYDVPTGTCSCCYDGGCYAYCVPPPTGDTVADPTPPPGVTPTPTPTPAPGTINAVARVVTADTSCAAVSSSTTGIGGTQFGFSVSSVNQPPPLVQADNTPVTFTNQPAGSYSINYTLPSAEWTLITPCLYRNGVLVGYGQSATLYSGDTLEWRFGFTSGAPWAQVNGGNVYASGTLRSYIPSVTPRVFDVDGGGGYPGIVTYGTDYDFDNEWSSTGNTLVSSQNWLVNTTQTRVNYYDYFYRKYGAPSVSTTNSAFVNPLAVVQPSSSRTPYYFVGDMTTSGDWLVGDGESIIVIVDGNATIGGKINIVGTGFVAFIVNGTITVSSNVGTTASSDVPVVEGIYIAMKADRTGGFISGTSTSASTARLVGKGMFIADDFVLQRNLDGYGVGNAGSAAELFIYNPRLLLTMPEEMKENSVTWQEVAP